MGLFDASFFKRLGFYMIGLSIGMVFLAIFLKKKSEETGVYFCYFPNCRTLKDIRSKPVFYSDEVQKLFQNKQLDSVDIAYFLNEGEVDFGKSNTKSVPCKTYFIEGLVKEKEALMKVENCLEKVLVQHIDF